MKSYPWLLPETCRRALPRHPGPPHGRAKQRSARHPGRRNPTLDVLAASVSSQTDIEGFAGQNIEVAVFYPEDDDYLIDRETTVTHYDAARAR
jgi:hypothetical protein